MTKTIPDMKVSIFRLGAHNPRTLRLTAARDKTSDVKKNQAELITTSARKVDPQKIRVILGKVIS